MSCPKTARQTVSTMRVAITFTPVSAASARTTSPICTGACIRTDRRARPPSGRSRSVLFLFYRPASSGHRQALPPDSVTDFLNVSCPHKQWHSVARRDITDPGRPSRMIPEAAGIRRFYRTMAGLKA
uniref:Uncharacterized protein n=1 Tax=Faecalibaculum rodentium TaxID=1702221 RepID=A0A140DXS6_9FIRM|nr:hypothetical protein AALO17_23190 [Faecalibaculum rodentium]